MKRLGVALLLIAFVAAAHTAEATIVERVVAVVGERPILLSDLRRRAHPFLQRIFNAVQDPTERAANETQMYKELLNRMIDDRLEEQAGDKAHLSITSEEIDNAIKNIAGQSKLSASDLLKEAKRQGLSEQDYRDELRRQLLEGKLIQLRVRGRVRITEGDGRVAFGRWLKENGAETESEVRILALRTNPDGAPEAIKAREQLAADISKRAKGGEDFCKLVSEYSDDTQTNHTCGSRGLLPMQALVKDVQEAVRPLKEGQVTDPIKYIEGGREIAVLVVQLHKAPKVPTYEDVKEQMMDRAYGEAIERQRKAWLDELRRGVYVDVRL